MGRWEDSWDIALPSGMSLVLSLMYVSACDGWGRLFVMGFWVSPMALHSRSFVGLGLFFFDML